jgi:dTDP-4-dehydrorhamnose reductase
VILVFGGDGQLGTAFRDVLPDARFVDRAEADLGPRGPAERLIRDVEPSAVINCAAFTAVDAAESEETRAIAINGSAVGEMAAACRELDIPFLTFSTDYVFAGNADMPYLEDDAPGPVSAYGRSKLIGEWMAIASHPRSLIVRTSWLISPTHDNFVTAILRRASTGMVRVVDDQIGKPTIAHDLAVAASQAIAGEASGIAHLANEGETTWFELAREIVRAGGMDPAVVNPCGTEEYPTPARRPAFSVLGTKRRDVPVMPPWRPSLSQLVHEQLERIG